MAEANEVKIFPEFDAMALHEDIVHGIYSFGFEKPSFIQQVQNQQLLSCRIISILCYHVKH
jgi:hypothetical protein